MHRSMIVTRAILPDPDGRRTGGFEVVVAECEACGFSAVSVHEHDALAIVERHQRQCPKALAPEESNRRIKVHHKGDAA